MTTPTSRRPRARPPSCTLLGGVADARDPLLGWRTRSIRYLEPLPNDQTYTQDRLRSLNRGRTIDEPVKDVLLEWPARNSGLESHESSEGS